MKNVLFKRKTIPLELPVMENVSLLIRELENLFKCNFKQAGTGPSRRHIQGSKIAKGLPRVNLQYSKIEKPKKMNRVARRGALKGGHFRNCQHFGRS